SDVLIPTRDSTTRAKSAEKPLLRRCAADSHGDRRPRLHRLAGDQLHSFRSRFRAHQAHAPVGGRRLRGVRPAFAVIGFALDNWIQSVAAVLMTATAVLMVIALRRTDPAI